MKFFTLSVLFLLPLLLYPQSVDRAEALNLAQKFMSVKCGKSVELTSAACSYRNSTNLYVFTSTDHSSFVVMSGSKKTYPVLAWSTESDLGSELPEPVLSYLEWAETQIIASETSPLPADSKVTAEWKSLAKNGTLPQYTKSSIAPLLLTTWDQGCYYNEDCPAHIDGPCGHCYAGCVATAMGQVMKYHNYPPTGEGSNIYGTGNYSNIHVDFSTATYEWGMMPNSISSSNPYIAEFLYHCGVSVNMGYAFDGSGASSQDAAEAFVNNFRYSDYTFYVEKSAFPDGSWIWVMENELNSRRPIYYSGFGPGGGHAFVLDGMDNSERFHVNWGWSGSANGYYLVSNLNPGMDFSQGQGAIFGAERKDDDYMYCQPAATFTAESDTIEDGSDSSKYGNDSYCSWTIQPPGTGLIYIHFTQLALDQDMDIITIYNGTSKSDPLVTTLTGFELPDEILVWGPSAYVLFESDDLLRADGFSFYYVSSQVGLEEAWNNDKISVFPNPADDQMTVSIDPCVLPAVKKIEIISLTGQTLFISDHPEASQMLDVSHFEPGMYGIRFVGNNDSFFSMIEVQ